MFLFSASTDKNTLKFVVVLFCNMRVLIYLNALSLNDIKYLIPRGNLGQLAQALLEEGAKGVVVVVRA